jgi:hypothetical protein
MKAAGGARMAETKRKRGEGDARKEDGLNTIAATIWDRSVVSRKQIMIVNHEGEFAHKLADWLAADGYEVIIAQEVRDVIDLLK